MIKESIKRGIMGIAGATLVSPLIALLIASISKDFSTITVTQYVLFTLGSAMIGFSFAAASVLFQIESISRLKATVLHFLCLVVSYFAAVTLAGWIRFDIHILITIASFSFSYAVSYISILIGLKVNENKINKALTNMHKEKAV